MAVQEREQGPKSDPHEEPAVGVPYAYPYAVAAPYTNQHVTARPYHPVPLQAFSCENPYQQGVIPPNAIFKVHPNGVPLQQSIYRDTPAPFECPHCGSPGLTDVKSKPSLAACVACMVSIVGVCFICPAFDCLWHKQHHCPSCGEKVADFKKSDPCMVMDPAQWFQSSFAVPS
ncbi:hypothetical protein KP509_01G018000 [Ceratopteris richardii]|uniref:LITAF domain-containing protein n=1 Tax=Ceratopteris richardii TaxID=49495 RepID=A0A8T2VME0_CERRI|nr:hypothetical protein KP509_01G018000 [Ceratopteris richardii]